MATLKETGIDRIERVFAVPRPPTQVKKNDPTTHRLMLERLVALSARPPVLCRSP